MSMKYRCTIDCLFLMLGHGNTGYSKATEWGKETSHNTSFLYTYNMSRGSTYKFLMCLPL